MAVDTSFKGLVKALRSLLSDLFFYFNLIIEGRLTFNGWDGRTETRLTLTGYKPQVAGRCTTRKRYH
jgi:hypothetical protein